MNKLLTLLMLMIIAIGAKAQVKKISGMVIDDSRGTSLGFANVVVKETSKGVTTDIDGKFTIEVDFTGKANQTLVISYISYETLEVPITAASNNLEIRLKPSIIMGREVVVTGSRVSETILESPASIQRLGAQQIQNTASGNFYEGLKNLRGVDINTSSLGFQAVNMRGFNTTAPVRVVQFIDGMDNQAPGLNFPVGNLVGANDLDLKSIEIITGPASALYGPNAFQGVINMITKNPFDYQGLDVQIKGGNRQLMDGQFRYATTFGKKNQFGWKLTGSYMQVQDWVANEPETNQYGDLDVDVDFSSIVAKLQFDQSLTQEERDDYVALNSYMEFNPVVAQRGLGKRTINAPGYFESELSDNQVKSLKLGTAFHYKIKDSLELSYNFRFGNGSAIYQGANRYSINNIMFFQNKVQLDGKRFSLKAYTTHEDAGDSYDIVFTGINMTRASIRDNYVPTYLRNFFDVMRTLTNDFGNDAQSWMVDSAVNVASALANASFFQPGTAEFDSAKASIITNSNLLRGSRFVDNSALYHIEGQYDFKWKFAKVIAGANARLYTPRSFGTIFSDTLVNRADTLLNGEANRNAEFVTINNWEVGGFVQASKRIIENLNIIASARVDKNQNFKPQFSPRLAFVYSVKEHSFRIGAQSAFRMPTLQNQFINLNLGPIRLLGNLDGFTNLYTLNSVQRFNEELDNTFNFNNVDPQILKVVELQPLRPEQVRTFEVGYRGILFEKLYIDADFFHNWYDHFIGDIRVVRPLSGAQAGETTGFDAILTRNYEVYQIATNAESTVRSYGAGIGLSYFFSSKLSLNTNYSFNDINREDLGEDIIPGFNTPKHKVNVGVTGLRVWKNFGFSASLLWADTYLWESPFGDGQIPSYRVVDAQLSYAPEKLNSIFRIGASNLFNEVRREIFGGPFIGRMIYASYTVNLFQPKR